MARTDTLPHFLSDVADAIRTAEGSSGAISASAFDTRIEAISGGGGADLSDYFESAPDDSFIDARSLIKQMPSIDMSGLITLDYMFENFTNMITAPTLTNLNAVATTLGMFMSCYALVNVPYYYMPGCNDLSDMFTSSEDLSDQSIDNIMQMCINCDNADYSGIKALEYVIPNALCYRAENLTHYQDFLNAGWVLYESDISGDEPEEPEEPEE